MKPKGKPEGERCVDCGELGANGLSFGLPIHFGGCVHVNVEDPGSTYYPRAEDVRNRLIKGQSK